MSQERDQIDFEQGMSLENIKPKLGATAQCSRAKLIPARSDPCGDGQLTFSRGGPALTLELNKVTLSQRSGKTGLRCWEMSIARSWSSSLLWAHILLSSSFPCAFSLRQTLVTLNDFVWNRAFLPLRRRCPFQQPGLSLKVGPM